MMCAKYRLISLFIELFSATKIYGRIEDENTPCIIITDPGIRQEHQIVHLVNGIYSMCIRNGSDDN